MENWLITSYRFLLRNWNALVAGVSLLGVLIVAWSPPLQQHLNAFIFAAANAVVWTLVEIKMLLSPNPAKSKFPNMRSARTEILREIKRASRSEGVLRIYLAGGRIRSMSEIVRQAILDLDTDTRKSSRVEIQLHCMDPAYLRSMILPGSLPSDEQRKRGEIYATAVEGFVTELKHLVSDPRYSSFIRLEITYFNTPPFMYCYVIGSSAVAWGFFTWSEGESDFEGPDNSCFILRALDVGFVETRDWLLNRMQLYEAQSGSHVAQMLASRDAFAPNQASRDRLREFDARAMTYDAYTVWLDDPVLIGAIADALGSSIRGCVVDVGGGTGALAKHLGAIGSNWLVLDPSQKMLEKAPGGVTRICARAEAMPIADESVDVVVIRSVLCYLDADAALAECRRVLKKSGVMLVAEKVIDRYHGEHRKWYHDITSVRAPERTDFESSAIISTIESAGFITMKATVLSREYVMAFDSWISRADTLDWARRSELRRLVANAPSGLADATGTRRAGQHIVLGTDWVLVRAARGD